MKQISLILVVFFIAVFVLQSAAATARSLVVVSGGFGSCPVMGSPQELGLFSPLSRELANSTASTDIVRTCFAFSSSLVNFDIVTRSEVASKNEFEVVKQAQSQPLIGFFRYLAQLAVDYEYVVLIGQSYGGWLMMQLTSGFIEPDALVTIDPISLTQCRPLDALQSGVRSDPHPCRMFPRDVDQYRVRARSHHWTHFYQTHNPVLHSGPSYHADRSIRLGYTGSSLNPFGAHYATERDERVWRKVGALLP